MTDDEALETLFAMANVQDGYAKKATDPGLKVIHKANAKAQREVAAVISDLRAERDVLRADRDSAARMWQAAEQEKEAAVARSREASQMLAIETNHATQAEADRDRLAAANAALEAQVARLVTIIKKCRPSVANMAYGWPEDDELVKEVDAALAAVQADARREGGE